MIVARDRPQRGRRLRPVLDTLEGRALLNAALPHPVLAQHTSAHVLQVQAPTITFINTTLAGGFRFINFDGPNPVTNAYPGSGTTMYGITNSGHAVGFTTGNNGLPNFATDPLKSKKAGILNINGSTLASVFGANSAGTVVGTDGANAFFMRGSTFEEIYGPSGGQAFAYGVNDHNTIVGRYEIPGAELGFIRVNANTTITINAPPGPTFVFVNAQGINNNGLVVGYYVGTDGQDHGFIASEHAAKHGTLTGIAVADPVIPAVPGEPGATFVSSQIIGINDHGIAVGYYGDSTGSQHGFLYNTRTGKYTFLDDPSEAFSGGVSPEPFLANLSAASSGDVEVTQITGITNSGEITGFYSDANGVFHGFVAWPTAH
jgi:hypothetical protein